MACARCAGGVSGSHKSVDRPQSTVGVHTQAAQARPGAGRPLNRTPATGRRSECVALSSGLSWALWSLRDCGSDPRPAPTLLRRLQKVFGPRSVIRPVRRSRCLVFSFSTARSQVQSNAVPRVQTVCWYSARTQGKESCLLAFCRFLKNEYAHAHATHARSPRARRAARARALARRRARDAT